MPGLYWQRPLETHAYADKVCPVKECTGTQFYFSTACHTPCVPPNTAFTCVLTGQSSLSLTSDLFVHKRVCNCANSAKRTGWDKKPKLLTAPCCSLGQEKLPAEGMIENLTEKKLGIHIFGNPSRVQVRPGSERKRSNTQQTLSTRKTKTAPRKLRQDC